MKLNLSAIAQASRNPRPYPSPVDLGNIGLGYAKTPSDRSLRFASSGCIPNSPDIFKCQSGSGSASVFSSWNPFRMTMGPMVITPRFRFWVEVISTAVSLGLASLLIAIHHVVEVIPSEEMRRIAARRIVAVMTGIGLARRMRTECKQVGECMRLETLTVTGPELAIAHAGSPSEIWPTGIGSVGAIYLRPEHSDTLFPSKLVWSHLATSLQYIRAIA